MGKYDKSRSIYLQTGSYVVKDIFSIEESSTTIHEEFISLLSLNTLYFSRQSRSLYKNGAKSVLKWLEEVLKNSPHNEKFILSQHIGPGIVNEFGDSNEWKDQTAPGFDLLKGDYNVTQEYQRIMAKYSDKIVISISGHTHTLKMNLPLYSYKDQKDSYLHLSLCSFTPLAFNNPSYYSLQFASTSEDTVSFSDLIAFEIDLTELKTRQKSLTDYILSDLFPIGNRSIYSTPTHSDWVNRFMAVINLFNRRLGEREEDEQILRKYLMFMVGHQEPAVKKAQDAINMRSAVPLSSPFAAFKQCRSVYCSCITLTFADFQKCLDNSDPK